ncbi:MAG: copper amine oxidase N-terminal domain-containing protein [Methylocystaceae bacterium]
MKKLITALAALTLLVSIPVISNQPVWGQQVKSLLPKVILDGRQISFDVPPVIENGRTLVPLRAIFEALGATVNWDETTQTVTAAKDNTTIKLRINSTTASLNGQPAALDVPAKIMKNRTLVPLRFVSEALGTDVNWNNENQTAVISSPQISQVININDPECFGYYLSGRNLIAYVIPEKLPPSLASFKKFTVGCFVGKDWTPAQAVEKVLLTNNKQAPDYNSAGFSEMMPSGGVEDNLVMAFLFDADGKLLGYHVITPENVICRRGALTELLITFAQPVNNEYLNTGDFIVTRKVKGIVDPFYNHTGQLTSSVSNNGNGITAIEFRCLLRENSDITYEVQAKDNSIEIKDVRLQEPCWEE